MATYDFDFFVIGGGSGGVRAARMAAGFGARVAIAEERYWGGTCVNVGCIPKKLFVYASQFSEMFKVAKGYGWDLPQSAAFTWQQLIANKDQEIARLGGVYQRLLNNAGAEPIGGHASLVDAHTVSVEGRHLTAEHILIATGGWPSIPAIPGAEHAITSNEAFHLQTLPRRVVIVGGGYIAVEFAGIFAGLGCEVTQMYRGPLFLRGFDAEVRSFLAAQMQHKGIDLRFKTDVTSITKQGEALTLQLKDGSSLACNAVMYATGRHPLTAGLGLEACGVALDEAGAVKVNDQYQTSVPSIYAVGDVTNRVNLTPVALAEGMAVAKRLFAQQQPTVDYDFIPTAVFSQPNIGTVGYTEEEARKKFGEVKIFKSSFTPLRFTISPVKEQTLMKLIVATATDRVVGAHMVGEDAGEIIQGIAIAMRAGATKAVFDSTIGIHPTSAEEFVTMRESVA